MKTRKRKAAASRSRFLDDDEYRAEVLAAVGADTAREADEERHAEATEGRWDR